jgi:hypothetical protein
MNELLAALMTCLLVGLLVVAMISSAGITYSYLSVLSTLLNLSRWCFHICADRTECKFTVEKWRRRGVQRQVGWSRLTAAAGFSIQQEGADIGKYRFSRFRQSRGAMHPPRQFCTEN